MSQQSVFCVHYIAIQFELWLSISSNFIYKKKCKGHHYMPVYLVFIRFIFVFRKKSPAAVLSVDMHFDVDSETGEKIPAALRGA